MSTVPANPKLRLEWYEAHIAQIAANAVAVGTTTTATTDLQTKITAARAKFNAKAVLEASAMTATSEWHGAGDAMGLAGSAIIDQIRAKAKTVGGNAIYDLAGIPAPATPAPVGPPGMPTNFIVELMPNGTLQLKWKCANPAGAGGTIYQISRRDGSAPTAQFQFLNATGSRKFLDTTVPAGVASVTYKIVAVRSTAFGTEAQFLVNFGVGGSGEAIASVVESAPRMAA